MIAAMIPVLLEILQAAPEVVSSVEKLWEMVKTNETPTADQQAQIDAALDAAHKELQA